MFAGKVEGYEFEIIQVKENNLARRKEVLVLVRALNKPTPTRDLARKLVINALKVENPELVVIKKIEGYFGFPKFVIRANIYYDKQSLEYFEPLHLLKRNGLVQEQNG